ncbi:MAG TPA: A/G-specific adenine glycosylase [Patescibacteria group bacterium]|nr:A/G-specific adenine glycosylase [Patescibacteria group bacterium]
MKKIISRHRYSDKTFRAFQTIITGFFKKYGRDFPWRNTHNPYHILVSEFMLQQTQTERVLKKYQLFIVRFPHAASLANASFQDVMRQWQGLGYNRRALFLQKTAQLILKIHDGICPSDVTVLTRLPGIGHATASAICAFAFNKPSVFVETNIRSVFLHFFFSQKNNVKDREILSLVEKTLDKAHPRQWYYGLMDYGAFLKKNCSNPSRKSAHHAKQSPFVNSNRQIRGLILKILTHASPVFEDDLYARLSFERKRVYDSVTQLIKEKLIARQGTYIVI